MKQLLSKFIQRFSQMRDYLIMALIGIAILVAMQTSQAIDGQSPESIWVGQYGDQVRTPVAGPGGMPGGGPGAMPGGVPGGVPGGAPGVMPGGAPGAAPEQGEDVVTGNIDFNPVPKEEIGPISYHPVFTPASNFSQLIKRLTTLRDEYQEAVKNGNIQIAIKKLEEYCREDPEGKLLEWPTPPRELLQNLVCSEIGRSITEASKQGEAALETAAQSGGDLLQQIESLDSTITLLERTVQEAGQNEVCLDGADVSQSQITSLEDTHERLLQARENLNKTLVIQRYEGVVRAVGAINSESEPEQVSQAIRALNEFKKILENRNNDYLTQSQIDRLSELQGNLDKNKDEIVKKVRQDIARLATDEASGRDVEGIREILRLYDVLEVLKVSDSDIARERRRWESTLSKLEAGEAVREMREKLREVRAAIENAEDEVAAGRVPADFQTTISDRMAEIQGIQGRTKDIRRVPGYGELRSEYQELRNSIQRLSARINSLQR